MDRVSLSLTGLNADVSRSEVTKELAQLYGKPESHFTPHCKHLFELHTPFVHLKQVSADEAIKHQARLAAIGIETTIGQVAETSGLSLVPIEQQASAAPECPACDQATTDPEMCSECGVMIKKFLEQKSIDENLQKKLAAADRSDTRIKQVRSEEDQRRKEAAARKKKTKPTPELQPELDDDHFVAQVVDKSSNRVIYIAGAALLVSVVGSGYFMLHMKKTLNQQAHYDYTEQQATDTASASTNIAANNSPDSAETDPLIETSSFSSWEGKMGQIKKLKNSLDVLNNTVGMASTMDGLVSETGDTTVRLLGTQHLVKLKVQQTGDVQPNNPTTDEPSAKALQDNAVLIETLSSTTEKLYACLHLAEVSNELDQAAIADMALEQAKNNAIEIANSGDLSQMIIAEVISAEYLANNNATDKMTQHYQQAVTFAHQIDTESEDAKWALAFIARSQARNQQFADAYALLEHIDNPRISNIVMDNINAFVATSDITLDEPTPVLTDGDEFADDPAMQLLFENQKKMQQNAKMLNGIMEQVTGSADH